MSFAALSTVIAVFENIVSFAIDLWGWSRKKAILVNLVVILVLSMPCVLGFNVLSGIQPLGAGTTIQDLEDFIISNNLLPIGSDLHSSDHRNRDSDYQLYSEVCVNHTVSR